MPRTSAGHVQPQPEFLEAEGAGAEAGVDTDLPSHRIGRRTLLGLFLVMLGVYGLTAGGHGYSVDDELRFEATRSLVHLDPSVPVTFANFEVLYRERDDGRYTTVYGIGQSAVAVPFYVVGRALSTVADDPGSQITIRTTVFMTNSVLGALLVVLVALLSLELGASRRGALLLALSYGLGTYAFPMMKTFGAEPGTALLVTGAAWLAMRARRTADPRLLFWAGLAGGGAGLFRSSALVFLPLVGLYILASAPRPRRRALLREATLFAGGSAVSVAVLLASNAWRYGNLFDIGYDKVETGYPVIRGVVNVLFSPGKSFFLFAPIVAVAVAATVRNWRSFDLRIALLGATIAVNVLSIARLPVWSGDHAWGPRYMQLVLPVSVVLAAPLIDRSRWRRAAVAAGAVGFLVPGLVGAAVVYDAFFIDASTALGFDGVPSEMNQPVYDVKVHSDLAWNQLLGQAELVPRAVRDVFGALRPGETARGSYSPDPISFYGFYGLEPRLDLWWLWVEPTNGSNVTYLLLIPLVAAAGCGVRLLRRGDRESSHRRQRSRVSTSAELER